MQSTTDAEKTKAKADTPLVKYVPGQSCKQKGKEHEYKKVYGKAYQRCAACGSTRTVHPAAKAAKAAPKADAGAAAPAKAGELITGGALREEAAAVEAMAVEAGPATFDNFKAENVVAPAPAPRGKAPAGHEFYVGTVEDLAGWKDDLEGLKDEIESWRDNMEGTGLENTPKFEEVSDAADQLDSACSQAEDVDLGKVPREVLDRKVQVTLIRKATSRSKRLSNALTGMEAAEDELRTAAGQWEEKRDAITQAISERPGQTGTAEEEASIKALEDAAQAMTDAADAISSTRDEAESVDFPGMY